MGADSPSVHFFLGEVRLGEEFLCGESHVQDGHHVPVQVGGIREEGHVRGDEPPVNRIPAHGYPGHVLIAARQDDVREALCDLHESHMNTCHARAALLVNKFSGEGLRQIGLEYGKAPSVGPLLAHGRCAPHNEIIDLFRLYSRPLDELREQFGQKLVTPHLAKPVPGRISWSGPGLSSP